MRLLPNMQFDEVQRKFESPAHNFIIKGIPEDWNHEKLYDLAKRICPAGNSILASKVSMKFSWKGPADEPSLELKGAHKGLKLSTLDDARIE